MSCGGLYQPPQGGREVLGVPICRLPKSHRRRPLRHPSSGCPAVRAGLRIGKGHINRLRIRPRSEHTPSPWSDRTGNEDLRDGSATSEGVVLDGRDPCGDSEFRQRGALPEGTLPDAGQALVQRDRGERSATVEGSATDSLETGRQSYGLQRLAVGKHAGVVPLVKSPG